MLVASMLLAENREVYIPAVDDHGVDMIVATRSDSDDRSNVRKPTYQEIQIKSLSKGGLFAAIKCDYPRDNYWFVFYIKDIDRMWLINSMDFVNISSRVTKSGSKSFGTYSLDLKPTSRTPIKQSQFIITNFNKLP